MANYYNTDTQIKQRVLKRFSMFDNAGLDISNSSSYEEALSNAGIDYEVERKELYLGSGVQVPDTYAMVRSNAPDDVIGVVGSKYQAVSNREAFAVAEELVNEGFANYEAGGPAIGCKGILNYSRSFMVLKGEDFEVNDEPYNSFIVFANSFDGSTGVQYKVINQRVWCLNGAVRYLGGKKNQLFINIQHSKQAADKINEANKIIIRYNNELQHIKDEAKLFTGIKLTEEDFKRDIVPFVLMQKGLIKEGKERGRGLDRVEQVVSEILQAYSADDIQNYNNTAYKVILALSDYETHSAPLRETGNGQVYMNRVLKGMVLTSAVAQYIASKNLSPSELRAVSGR